MLDLRTDNVRHTDRECGRETVRTAETDSLVERERKIERKREYCREIEIK